MYNNRKKNNIMSLRLQLRNLKRSIRGRRWTIREKDGYLTEVKMIFNPDEYIQS